MLPAPVRWRVVRVALKGVRMASKRVPSDDEFPVVTYDSFESLRGPDDEPESPVQIDSFPVSIPDPPQVTHAAKSAPHKPKEG